MSESASSEFMHALSRLGRRGWYSSWPSAADGASFIYAAFDIHPEDVASVFSRLVVATRQYGGETRWVVFRHGESRFVLFPEELQQFNESGNIGNAAVALHGSHPTLHREAAADLRRLSRFLVDA
jgi:hypothetical protein